MLKFALVLLLLSCAETSFAQKLDSYNVYLSQELIKWSVTGDFDDDNKGDVLIGSQNNVLIFKGAETRGQLQNATESISDFAGPSAIAHDFNGDGLLDLVTSRGYEAGVNFYMGFGDGLFAPPLTTALSGYTDSILAEDFNKDGALDLIVQNGDELTYLQGIGNGSFSVAGVLQEELAGKAILASGDFNGDSWPDLVIATDEARTDVAFLWLRSGGATGFSEPQAMIVHTPLMQDDTIIIKAIVAGDFDSNGSDELMLAAIKQDSNLDFWLEPSDAFLYYGAITESTSIIYKLPGALIPTLNTDISSLSVGDYDADGHLDVFCSIDLLRQGFAYPGYVSSRFVHLLSDGAGNFTSMTALESLHQPTMIYRGDLDGSAPLDIIFHQDNRNDLCIATADCVRSFTWPEWHNTSVTGSTIASGELNNDGITDFALGTSFNDDFYSGTFSFFYGGQSGGAPSRYIDYNNTTLMDVGIADFDQDGIGDIIAANRSPSSVSISWGSGDYFDSTHYMNDSSPAVIEVGDLNNNGMPDFVTGAFGDGEIQVHLATGAATFASPQILMAGESIEAMELVDLNADGWQDIVYCTSIDTLGRLMNDGQGAFTALTELSVSARPTDLATIDLNGDNHIDLAVSCRLSNKIELLQGDGSGGFLLLNSIDTMENPSSILSVDIDSNGSSELVVSIPALRSLAIYPSDGNGSYLPPQYFGTGLVSGHSGMLAADVNIDGFLDIVMETAGDGFSIVYGSAPASYSDCNGDGIADLCEVDCDNDGTPDDCAILQGLVDDLNTNGVPDPCESFVRGDTNIDGSVDVADAITDLDYQFSAGPVSCLAAHDSNADSLINIGDAIFTLSYLFASGPSPTSPFPSCGIDNIGTYSCDFSICP